ncbi:MAG TPA: tetratricopeptide repeat protein [Chitinophagaceae bacterium]|nr:tetratricopeptide repeat protein [Chitinophagaceae bacterium]
MPESRQLAAIIFADIAGYTAMMQQNEHAALEKINRFRQVLENETARYNGKIIQFYGDGCLLLFNSVVDAINYANHLQEEFRVKPEIPVRIGVHLGDVVIKEGNVFGDGVNVASRIQSLGQPNSVLFSGEVQDKIKNNPVFHSVSLGKFHFKNVSNPIEVYALSNFGLIVPQRKNMEGKLKKGNPLKRNLIGTLLLILILIAAVFIFKPFLNSKGFTGNEKSIVVLPFVNMSSDRENEYFSDGMTEEITTQLSRIGDLKVIARTSAMLYKGSKKSVKEIAGDLHVAAILEGSVQKTGNAIKITVQLIDANTEHHIWAEKYEKDLKDVFSIQNEVARHIALALEAKLFQAAGKQAVKKETENLQAYNLYLKGRYYLNKGKEGDLGKALEYFDQAIEKDSAYAKAHAGRADVYLMLGEFDYIAGIEAWPKAEAAVKKALQLDETLADAHTSLGHLSIHLYNWPVAKKELTRAIELSPTQAEAHHFMSQYLAVMGRMNESISEILKAQELDPLSLLVSNNVGQQLFRARRMDEAMAHLKKTLELQPDYPQAHRTLARVYMAKGMYLEGIDEFERSLLVAKSNPTVLGYLGHAYGRVGERKKALEILDELKIISKTKDVSGEMALVHIGLDNKEIAFELIEKAISELSVVLLQIKVDPEYDSIRNHPKYIMLLKKMGLE